MGRWQREYEREWRSYTHAIIQDFYGKNEAPFSSIITQRDEQKLSKTLAAEGISHVPPNHRRWHAATPTSPLIALDAQDSLMSEGSYIYSTPPPSDDQNRFPICSSQDFRPQSTFGRRVSASQRLRARMADMSPIAANRRTSIEHASKISPPSVAKSPWTFGQQSPKVVTRRTPRQSLEFNDKDDEMNDSMQSMHLCDNEGSRTDDEDVKAEETQLIDVSEVYDEEEKTAKMQRENCAYDDEQDQEIDCVQAGINEQDTVQYLMVKHRGDVEDVNVPKKLFMISSNSMENGKDEETKEQADTYVEKELVNADSPHIIIGDKVVDAPLSPRNITKRPTWASDVDFDYFGAENEYEHQQLRNGEKDVETHVLNQSVAESAPCLPDEEQTDEGETHTAQQNDIGAHVVRTSTSSVAKNNSAARQKKPELVKQSAVAMPAVSMPWKKTLHACPKALSGGKASYTTYTALLTTNPTLAKFTTLPATFASPTASFAQKASHVSPTIQSAALALPPAVASSKSGLSHKRDNRGALLRTKLPLEMEYRFAGDQRRRHRRQKNLAAKVGRIFSHCAKA